MLFGDKAFSSKSVQYNQQELQIVCLAFKDKISVNTSRTAVVLKRSLEVPEIQLYKIWTIKDGRRPRKRKCH